MKKIFSLIAVIFCALSALFAQVPAIQWQNTIGGNSPDGLESLQQTADGGYILGGWSNSNISGDKTENNLGDGDYWVVKLNASGAIQWQNTIGGNKYDRLYSLQQTADGGYILGGTSGSNISGDKTENSLGDYDYWVLKLNASGAIQWQNTIGGNGRDELYSLRQTADGGYILGGDSNSNISGDKTENGLGGEYDFWVLKLDATGAIQWQNTIGGNGYDSFKSVEQTADGGYILGGWSDSNISGDKTENSVGETDYWVLKLNASGGIQWQNTIGGYKQDVLYSVHQTADNGFILGGQSNSNISGDKSENSWGNYDYWVVKLDVTGVIEWQNTIGGGGYDRLVEVQQTAEGGYILGGYSDSNVFGDKSENSWGGFDYWVLKLSTTGGIQWQNTSGGYGNDLFSALQQTADGAYILGGESESIISGNKTENCWGFTYDYWVLKLAPGSVPTGEAPASASVALYPNPTSGAVFVRSESTATLCLRNAFGQILSTQTVLGEGKIDLSRCPNGMYYLVEIETGAGHKILKQ